MGYTDPTFGEFGAAATSSVVMDSLGAPPKNRKRKQRADDYLANMDIPAISVATASTPTVAAVSMPPLVPNAKRQRTSSSDVSSSDSNAFQHLLFRSFAFMTLDEIRSLCQQSDLPFFVKVRALFEAKLN